MNPFYELFVVEIPVWAEPLAVVVGEFVVEDEVDGPVIEEVDAKLEELDSCNTNEFGVKLLFSNFGNIKIHF